jgi:hypothetical protein
MMTMKMFSILDMAKPEIESIRRLNLVAGRHTIFQVTAVVAEATRNRA